MDDLKDGTTMFASKILENNSKITTVLISTENFIQNYTFNNVCVIFRTFQDRPGVGQIVTSDQFPGFSGDVVFSKGKLGPQT